jgi:hypothetical protein
MSWGGSISAESPRVEDTRGPASTSSWQLGLPKHGGSQPLAERCVSSPSPA